jgi:3-oxoacyl-[acyl-carrier-protein] synthase-3
MPATACLIQDALGAKHAAAFDLSAGCTGFVYALSVASAMVRAGDAKIAVVIGSETMSRIVDWQDRSTCVLFGDGAGAIVLQASEEPGGVLSTVLGSDGAGGNHLIVPAGGSKMPTSIQTIAEREHFIKMNGPEVFRFATRVMGKASKEVCDRANIDISQIDLFIPHQANTRIIKSAAKNLGLDPSKIYENLHKYGNTSSASIPVALCEAIQEGRIKEKDHLIFVGFGAGLTWGASMVQWGMPVPFQQRQRWYRALRWIYYRWVRITSKAGWILHSLESRLARRPPLLPFDEENESYTKAAPSYSDTPAPNSNGRNGSNGNGVYQNGHQPVEIEPTEAESIEDNLN